jgi:hydroxymethylbilane synthase
MAATSWPLADCSDCEGRLVPNPVIRLGTRRSALALAQARLVSAALEATGTVRVELVTIETAGDRRRPDTSWGEGAFVAAIERALLDDRVDIAVHSAKDVPTQSTPGLMIAAYLKREDPRDALVVRAGDEAHDVATLRSGARVGTDSPRRTGFLRARRADLAIHPLHGNVDTRLRRLDAGETDALILAVAGLTRLGLAGRITAILEPSLIPPAPGQGAVAIQIRSDDETSRTAVARLDHRPTRLAVEAERAFLAATGGGCRAPIGALAVLDGDRLDLLGGWAAPDGSASLFGSEQGWATNGVSLGRTLAARLRPPRRVLVTRAVDQSDGLVEALRAAGLRPVAVPAIVTVPVAPGGALDEAAANLGRYDWVVVTSANGARAMLGAADRVGARPTATRWAAIGAATRAALEGAGIPVAHQPGRADATSVAAELPLSPGQRVLLARADLADAGLAEALRARGAEVEDVVAYRTHEAPESSRPLLEEALDGDRIDAVLFTSGSTVRGLLALGGPARSSDVTSIAAICIGPETAEAARRAGFTVIATSPMRDSTALATRTAEILAERDGRGAEGPTPHEEAM